MATHAELYVKTLNGYDLTPLSLLNFPLLEYCYRKNKDSITNHEEANKILAHQRWTDKVWGHSKIITAPKYTFHVDFELFISGEYPNLVSSIITNAITQHRNITTSIHLDAFQTESYYHSWCSRLDKFLLNNERKQMFDYLNIYIDANEVELADAWLNTPVYTSYSNVFDVIKLCSSIACLTKVNVLYVNKLSPKTGRPIYDNILNSQIGLGWPLNLYNKHRELCDKLTLVMMDDGKTAYIKNIHTSDDEKEKISQYVEKYWKNRTFDAIEFDSRLTMLPNAVNVDGSTTRYRIELSSPPPQQLSLTARLSALLPWLRSYVSL
jgi:hypothetical protein